MPYQRYHYQYEGSYQKSRLNSAIRRWQPGDWDTMTSAGKESFTQYTALGWLAKEAQEWDPFGRHDDTLIKKDEWNENHYLWRDDINWDEDMSIGVARVRRERSDNMKDLALYRNNVDFWSLPNLAGTIMGAMVSPENLVAWGGMIGRAGTLATLARTTRVPMIPRYVKPVFRGMADAAIADTLFQTVKASVQVHRGENIDLAHAAFEIGIAGMTGGFIGTFPMAYQVAKKVPSAFRPVLVKKALSQIAKSKPVSLFKNRGNRSVEEEMSPDQVKEAIKTRTKGYADDAEELYKDASKGVVGDYRDHLFKQGKTLMNKLTNCLKFRGKI